MFEITHQKARALLQAAADQQLSAQDKTVLDAHLSVCKDCSSYAGSLTSMEIRLRSVMQAQWDKQRPSLEMETILHPTVAKRIWNNVLSQANAMGKVTIVAALLLGYVVLSNLFGIQSPILEDKTPTTVPTPNELTSAFTTSPTPLAQLTLTGYAAQNCETVTYIVQTADTLESLALRYGVQKSAIIEHNNLLVERVSPEMELLIPLCERTPYLSATTTNNTMTITPLNGTLLPLSPE